MHYHRDMMQKPGMRQKWQVSTEHQGPPVPWRPGYGLPRRWKTRLEREGLPYLVELEFAAGDDGPQCRSIRLDARANGVPIGARDIRKVPIGECVQLAIASAAMREERHPGEIVYQFGGGHPNITEQVTLARPVDERTKDAHLREVADIYQSHADTGKPTQAVQDAFNRPYSTAARWVMQARQRGFLPPTKQGRGGNPAPKED
jgi:hypothetical protein